ncbi:hypothetical protein ACQ4PT_031161 [Festuca glaucescens]
MASPTTAASPSGLASPPLPPSSPWEVDPDPDPDPVPSPACAPVWDAPSSGDLAAPAPLLPPPTAPGAPSQLLSPAAPVAQTRLPPPPDRLPPNFRPQVVGLSVATPSAAAPSAAAPSTTAAEDVGGKLGWQEVHNRRRPQQCGKPPSPRRVDADRAKAFRRRVRGQCFRCLEPGHLVAACHGRIRCLSCRRSGHRERDCWQHKKANQVTAPVCSGSPAIGLHRPLDRSWASVAAFPAVHEDCVRTQRTAGAASASSAVPPDEVLKSALAEQATMLRVVLQEMASVQFEELIKPVRVVSENLECLLERLGGKIPLFVSLTPSKGISYKISVF